MGATPTIPIASPRSSAADKALNVQALNVQALNVQALDIQALSVHLEPRQQMDTHKPRYTPMNRRRRIYEGKAKVLYEGPEPGTLIQHFKDDATAHNSKKHQVIEGKGVLNNRISEYVFQHLNDIGVPTHFIRRLNMREQLIREVEIIPLE